MGCLFYSFHCAGGAALTFVDSYHVAELTNQDYCMIIEDSTFLGTFQQQKLYFVLSKYHYCHYSIWQIYRHIICHIYDVDEIFVIIIMVLVDMLCC